MSRDIVPRSSSSVGLVVPTRVQDQLADQLAVLREHAHPQTVDERQDPGAREPPSEPDVVQPRVVTKRDHPGDVDLVPADPEVGGDLKRRERR